MSGEKMVLNSGKFICILCGERMDSGKNYIRSGNVGVCEDCFGSLAKTSPALPYPGTKHISYIISPFEYGGALRDAILEFKFKGSFAYAPLFAKIMRPHLATYDIWKDFDCIVPIPLHKKRLKERGYNQSELVAKGISEYLDLPLHTDILSRPLSTKRQSGLEGLERVKNVQGAFSCSDKAAGKRVILFDDICTTGNTLEAAASALALAGAEKICAVTLAMHVSKKIPGFMY